jgi:serine/threonine-protein kinase
MGTVYLAREESQDRTIALKVLSDDLRDSPGFAQRFLREAQTLRQVEHPNVIPVYSAGDAAGVLYIATRYVPSGDLAGVLARKGGRLPAGHVAAVIKQVAGALDAAHGKWLVHRDVKPANILVDTTVQPHGHAYLSGFGLIRDIAAPDRMTSTGVGMGTPAYCSPEQVAGRDLDGRADQYSLACVAFELLTGRVPYPGRSGPLAFAAHVTEPVPSAARANPAVHVPAAADQVLQRAMAKDPGHRYPSCGQFANALGAAFTSSGYTPTRVPWTPAAPAAPDHTSTRPPPDHSPTRPPAGYGSTGGPGSPPTWAPPVAPSSPGTPTRLPPPTRAGTAAPPSSGAPAGARQATAASWPPPVPVPRRRSRAGLFAVGATAIVALAAVILVVPKTGHLFGTGSSPGTGSSVSTGHASSVASLRWSHVTGTNINASNVASAGSSPVAADGTVYAGGNNALNAANGHVRWSYAGGTAESGPVVVDGTVYVVDGSGNVHALNAVTGHVNWSHSIPYAGTGLAVADGLVYVSSIGDIGYVYALNAATGHLAWSFKTLNARESVPTVADGVVYVGCGDGMGSSGTVFALDAATGHLRWSYTTGPAGNVQPPVESSPAVVNGTVYVGSDYGAVYALDAATGRLRWSFVTGGGVVSSPVVAGGTVYVGSEDDKVYALDSATGHLVWSYPTGDIVVASPAVAAGIVYAASDDGKLYALATAT